MTLEHNATRRARERREHIRAVMARNHAAGLHRPRSVEGCVGCEAPREHLHEWADNSDWDGGPSDTTVRQCLTCNAIDGESA